MLLFYLSLIQNEEERINITRIYETYLDWMLKMAFHFLNNETDAEDAVNDVFLSLIKGNSTVPVDSENETKAYLFICIRNAAFKIKESKSKHKTVNYDGLFNVFAKYNLEDACIKKDCYNEVLSFINAMSPIYKDVLALKLVFNKSLKEISEMLKVHLKTIETRFSRGKSLLKERFGDIDI